MTSGRRPARSVGPEVLVCVDVGSTFTKAAAVAGEGRLIASAEVPTTRSGDVLTGLDAAVTALGIGPVGDQALLVCSSAGGGLRLAVVGQERVVSVEAGRRVALSAGARVIGTWAGPLDPGKLDALVGAAADVVLLVGGTDGGDPEVLLHNARALGRSALRTPVVVAGNSAVARTAVDLVRGRHRVALLADNVIPRIGELAARSARSIIREVFIRHVIGGKGLSIGTRFAGLVRCATPDAALAGVEMLAAVSRRTRGSGSAAVLALDIGGATTDVFSVHGEQVAGADDVVGRALAVRTVEGDLGVRSSAPDLVLAAEREGLLRSPRDVGLSTAAGRRAADVGLVPSNRAESAEDLALAGMSAVLAVRRHARPPDGQDLRDVGLVVGSGGVLRHAEHAQALGVMAEMMSDRSGGWALPRDPRIVLDADYLLAPIGLLAMAGRPELAERLAGALLGTPATAGPSRSDRPPEPPAPRSRD